MLKKIEIEGSSFSIKQEIELKQYKNGYIALIVGKNGSGKTNIFRAIDTFLNEEKAFQGEICLTFTINKQEAELLEITDFFNEEELKQKDWEKEILIKTEDQKKIIMLDKQKENVQEVKVEEKKPEEVKPEVKEEVKVEEKKEEIKVEEKKPEEIKLKIEEVKVEEKKKRI
jgi:energy-coupling factor transporter ATP-binding protein EcfA2